MGTADSKSMFFFKAFLAGIIGSSALYYFWAIENTIIDLMVINFHWYFGEIIIFWFWLGKDLAIKGWLRAGFVGSLIYSVVFVLTTNFAEGFIGKPFESIWVDVAFILLSIVAGGLGALPQWFVSRKVFSNAHLWIVVNAIGYGMLRFSYWLSTIFYENDFLSFRQFLNNMSNAQWFNNLTHVIRYGLLGIILGIALYNFVQSNSVTDKSREFGLNE